MSSVTFPTAIGGDGSTVTDDDNATTGLRNGGWRTRFIPCFTNLVDICDYTVSYAAQAATFAEPPPMGSTTPNTGAFTRITVTGSTAPANGLYLPAANSLGFATNSTERVRLDASGNVGIGTSSPQSLLHLNTDGTALRISRGSAIGFLYNTGTSATDITRLQSNGGSVQLYTAGGTATLDSSGNLGLGVTPSAWTNGWKALQIGGGALSWSGTGTYTATQLSDNSYFTGSGASTVTATYIYGSTPATNYKQYNGAHYWYNAPSGTAGNAISFTQAMTLTAGNNLLLGGTSDPGGSICMYIANRATVPGTPSGGGVIYVEAGALKYKGSSGTITTLGAA